MKTLRACLKTLFLSLRGGCFSDEAISYTVLPANFVRDCFAPLAMTGRWRMVTMQQFQFRTGLSALFAQALKVWRANIRLAMQGNTTNQNECQSNKPLMSPRSRSRPQVSPTQTAHPVD